jgi:chitodextrinase
VEVLPVNDAPVIIQSLPAVTMMHNTNHISEPLDLYFADLDSPLSYHLSGTQNVLAELIAGNRISLTPAADWYGTEYLNVMAVDDSLASVEQSFRISVIRDFFITEDFNHSGSLPTGWIVNTVSGSANWIPIQESGTDYAMQVQNPNASTISAYRLMSPAYNFSQYKDITVSFDYSLQGVNSAIFQYSTTGITWTPVATLASNTSGRAEYLIPALQQQSTIRFRWSYQTNSLLSNSWRIDDFEISGLYGDFVRPSTILDLEIVSQTTNSVSLAWTPCVEEYFERYEILYSLDSVVNTQDPVWSVSDDPDLGFLAANTTMITGLSIDTQYWFMIRGVDSSGNIGLASNTPNTFLNQLPVLHSPYPAAGVYHDSRSVSIGISAEDDIMLLAASFEYRADLNGNGVYDEDEVWTPVTGYSNAPQLEIRVPVTYATDGDNLRYEFRIKDIPGVQYVYSGSESLAGIEDDYGLLIDTIAPSQIEDLLTISSTSTSVTLNWGPAYDLHFAGYEVYYATSPQVDENASVWNYLQDSNLADMASSSTQITGLAPDTRYWFRIAARDLAGNLALLSNETTNIANSEIPVFHDPYPEQGTGFSNSRTVQIGTWIYDAYGIDNSRIHYRFDANGNGIYDQEETWAQVQTIDRSRDEGSIYVSANVTYESDGNALAFEFRAWDVDGYGPAYSGTSAEQGIEDDWTLAIDTLAPAVVQNLLAGAQSQSSIQLAFSASNDLNFSHYEVYYAISPEVGLTSLAWTPEDDPNLGQIGTGTIVTTITGLQISTRYYIKVRAVDLAGNSSWSSEVNVSTLGAFPPATPQNFRLEISGNDVILSWDPVTTNSNGDPMEVAAYLIYGSTDPYFEADFGSLLDITEQNFYVFEDIAAFIPYVFFRVSALDQFDDRQVYTTGKAEELRIQLRIED